MLNHKLVIDLYGEDKGFYSDIFLSVIIITSDISKQFIWSKFFGGIYFKTIFNKSYSI